MRQRVFLFIAFIMLTLMSCSKDEHEPSAEEKFLTSLAGTWDVTDVTLDGETVTGEFDNMTISFNKEKTFLVTNPVGNIWPASGMFDLQETAGELFDLLRDDDVVILVNEMTDTRVVLSFQFDHAPGRQWSLAGEYVFTLTK